jgi:hypothetical protein
MDSRGDETVEKLEKTPARETPIVVERLVFRRNGASGAPVAATGAPSPGSQDRKRLSPKIDRRILDQQLEPVRKHYPSDLWDESWSLYWLPAGFRRWPPDPQIVEFLNLVVAAVQQPEKHHAYTFLEQSAIHPHLTQPLIVHAAQYIAVPMIAIRPEAGKPRFPTTEAVKNFDPQWMGDIAQQKNMEIRLQDFFPDAPVPVYWIREGHAEARKQLSGQGGWSFILSDLAEDEFFEAAKEILLKDVEDEGIKSFPLIGPLLSTQSFIQAPRANLEAWFRLCPLYMAENIDEKGLTIASSSLLDDVLIDCVKRCGLRQDKNARRAGRGW